MNTELTERELTAVNLFIETFSECTDKGFPFEAAIRVALKAVQPSLELGTSLAEIEKIELKSYLLEWDKNMKDDSLSISERLDNARKLLKGATRLQELENGN